MPRLATGALFACLLPAAGAAIAQAYPTRPVRFIIAQLPGGNADIVGRAIAAKLGERLGQQLVVDNRPGGGGVIATEVAVRAAPDGYTVLLVASAFGVNPSVRKLPYDPIRDLAPVSLAGSAPNILVVYPGLPVKSVQELAALARAKPGQLRFVSSGNGGSPHLAGELFKLVAKVDMVHVPYRGAAPAMVELAGGQVELSFASMPSALSLVRAGKLRALAVTGAKRSVVTPELPTIAESGLPSFETAAWQGILAPAATPRAIVERLSREIATVVRQPELRERLLAEGAEPVGSTPEEFARYIRVEIDKWARVVKATGLRVD